MQAFSRVFLLILIGLGFSSASIASAAGAAGFEDGETFVYRVSWGIFLNAGVAVITAERAGEEDENLMRLTLDIEAQGVVGRFLPFDQRILALIENDSGRLLHHREIGYDGRQGVDKQTTFDYTARQAVFVDHFRPERNRIVEFPPDEEPTDLLFGLVETRRWHMRPGEERNLLVYAGRDVYPLVIRAEEYEQVWTPSESFWALLLAPRMRTEPKGIFARGGDVKVWITEGPEPQPVRIQLRLGGRLITLTLTGYDPGR